MKCKNVFSFGNLHIQNGIVFAVRLLIAGLLCFLWIFLKGRIPVQFSGYIKLIQCVFILWMIYSLYEYALSWIFPRIRSLAFEQDKIIINDKDTYTYTKDAFLSSHIFRFTPIDLNLFLNVRDEAEGRNRIYFFGNVIWSPESAKRKEVKEKIVSFENKLFEKFAYAYLCEDATEDNTLINVDIKRINKEHLIEALTLYIPASVLMTAAMINVLVRPLFFFLFAISAAIFAVAILNGIRFRKNSRVFINNCEVTRTGIRIDSDLYSISKDLSVTYLSRDKETKELKINDKGSYLTLTDGKNSKRYWLGYDHLYRREQVLIRFVLDNIVKYVKSQQDCQ